MIVARYTSNVSGYVPTFNNGYVYSVNEQLNNGVYTVEIESDTDFSSVKFGSNDNSNVTSLLSVEYLKITNKVSSLQQCFRICVNVTSINTDGWDTSNVTNLFGTFNGCSKLTTLDVSKLDTSNVTTLYTTFYNCSALTSLDVSEWDTGKVTTLYGTFYNCSALTSLDVSKWDISNVITLNTAFYNCSALTSLDVSKWDTSNVDDLRQTFRSCSKLTSLDVSEWDTGKVTTLESTFQNCSALTTLDVSKWNTGNVATLYGTFNNCSKLTTLDVSKWDTGKVTSLQQTFYSCSALTSLDVSKWDTGKVTTLYAAFQACSKLTTLDVSKWDTKNVNTLYTTFYNCSALTSLDVSKWDTGNVTNLQQTFNTCSALTSLDVSKWNTSKVTTLRSTFNNCSALTSLDVSGWDTKNVTTLYATFSTCSKLTSLDLSGWDTSNVDTLYGTFLNCTALTSLDVSEWDTGKVTNLEATFYNCSKLTSLDLSGWDTSNVDTLHQTFRNCSALTSLDVSKWDTGNVTNLVETFYKCPAKYIGVLYCSDDTITKLANAITTQCDFYLDRININSPNPLVNFIEYKECKKEVIYYDSEDNSWKKPVLREWDSIEKHSNGKYYYHKRSGEVVLDGSQQIGRPANPSHTIASLYAIYINDVIAQNGKLINDKLLVGSYSTFFTIGSTEKGIATYNGGARNYIAYNTTYSKTSDIDTVRNELRADPITVVYQLAEEKVYECTDLDLISYADKTNLMVESGAIPHKTTLKIHQNITNITTILQEKVNVLENNANTINSEIETINSNINTMNTEIETINNTMNTEIDNINTDLIGVSESIEGSWLSVDSKDGYLKNVEILGNMIQDANNLEDIRSVGDKVENQELYEIPVLSTGKNLAKLPTNTFELIDGELCFKTNRYTFPYNNYKQNTQYTLTAKGKYFNGYATKLKFEYTDGTYSESSFFTTDLSTRSITSQSGKSVKSAILEQNGDGSYVVGIYVANTVQLEEGTVATPYEPYQGDKITILSPTPLEKIDNVADRIICKDGVWGVEKNITTINLTGNELWSHHTTVSDATSNLFGLNYTRVIPKGQAPSNMSVGIYSNKFLGLDATTLWKLNSQYNERIDMNVNGDIHIRTIKYATVSEFTAWLQETNMFIKYVLAQPRFIPLPYDQQIKLRTFANITNISFGCEIEPTLKASIPKSIGASVNSNAEQIDNLSKELQKINNLEESVTSEVVSESESDFITVKNTNNGYFEDVKLEGRTLVNLYPKLDAKNYKTLGVTLSDDTITINADGDWKNFTLNKDVLQLKTSTYYTFVIDIIENTIEGNDPMIHFGETLKEDPTKFSAAHGFYIKDKKGIYTFKLKTKDSFANINLDTRDHLVNTATGGTIVFKYMILEGDHTQNPPEFFEGLKSVGDGVDEISVKSVNENLFDKEKCYRDIKAINSLTVRYTENGRDILKFKQTHLRVYIGEYFKPNTQYTLKLVGRNIEGSVSFTITYTDDTTNTIWISPTSFTSVVVTSEKNKTIKYIRSTHTDDYYGEIDLNEIILVEGDVLKNISHQSNEKPLLYYNPTTQTWEKPILRQWDSIEKHADGKYYYHQRSGGLVLDGSEDWRDYGSDATTESSKCFYLPTSITRPYRGLYMCDRLKFGVYNASLGQISDITETINSLYFNTDVRFTDYVYIRINISLLESPDVSGFKAWLQANNVTVVYQLAEEKVYECTDLDLISYADETNLLVISGALNPKVSLKVSNGVGNVVTLLQNKVTMLEQMVYNLMKMLNNQQSNIDE